MSGEGSVRIMQIAHAIEARLRIGSDAPRDRRRRRPRSRPPPTVQQAVNSDISVNKHFGPHPFGGPKV